MANKLGIQKLKTGVLLIIMLAEATDTSLQDGKFQINELLNFLNPLTQLPAVLEGKEELLAELKDLDAEEMQELSALVKAELNLTNPNTEKIVETAVDTIIQVIRLVTVLKGVKSTTADAGNSTDEV